MNYAKIEMSNIYLKRSTGWILADCIYRHESWCGESCPCVKEDETYIYFCKGILQKEMSNDHDTF